MSGLAIAAIGLLALFALVAIYRLMSPRVPRLGEYTTLALVGACMLFLIISIATGDFLNTAPVELDAPLDECADIRSC